MWVTIGIIFAVVWVWLLWEAWNTPLMPDNYDIEEEDLDLENENN